MQETSDDAVLTLAIQGDREAFGDLYAKYVERIYAYIFYRTGNSDDAEDLTEKVFFRAMDHITDYRNIGIPFSAWLYRIAHNLVANWHRDNHRRNEISLDERIFLEAGGEHPELELLRSEERERLLNAIRSLPADRQHLLLLKFVEHLSNLEIGQIMGRSEGAIKSLYHRTLLSLRLELGS